MIHKIQLIELVEKTLKSINLYTPDAATLIIGTVYQESSGGTYIIQLNEGPALGICQMEPRTFNDILINYLNYNRDLKIKVIVETNVHRLKAEALEYNLALSIAFCRLHYLRVPEPIPSTIEGYAYYWKTYYNTHLGAGTVEEFINNYKRYIL